jgi:hypothetical protein
MFEGISGKKRTAVNKNAAYHITITNNTTGKVEWDADTNAILGAFDMGDRANGVCMTAADAITCATVLDSAREAVNNFAEAHPELDIIMHIISEKDRMEPADESEDTAE